MNAPIRYEVSRNVAATDKDGNPCKIALVTIIWPDQTIDKHHHCIPEGLLATIPPEKRDDFIASEVEALVGYEVTRQ